jgi:hypothetical protein
MGKKAWKMEKNWRGGREGVIVHFGKRKRHVVLHGE